MEKEAEEDKPKKQKLIVQTPDWLDLPDPIATNIILEHLGIIDYLQFSAVCKKWQSIQKEHRIRYSPYPPPSPLSFPWLIITPMNCNKSTLLYNPNEQKTYSIPRYNPNEQKTYSIPLPKTLTKNFTRNFGHGCFLLLFDGFNPSLYIINPITGVQTELRLFLGQKPDIWYIFFNAHISSTPTDPDCTIAFTKLDGIIYLYRLNDNSGWKTIDCSEGTSGRSKNVFCNNKLYHVVSCERLFMIDALLPDTVEMIKMDSSDICAALRLKRSHLVDFIGELVMVIFESIYNAEAKPEVKEFHVYRADFSLNKWMRMESLGDHVLFFSLGNFFSLPAGDIGCKENTIYYCDDLEDLNVAWRAFNLSTKNWINGPPAPYSFKYPHRWGWFLPTLDYFNVEKVPDLS